MEVCYTLNVACCFVTLPGRSPYYISRVLGLCNMFLLIESILHNPGFVDIHFVS